MNHDREPAGASRPTCDAVRSDAGPPLRGCQTVAEIGANHDGSLARACELIERAALAGADVAKFQSFRADYIVSDVGFRQLGKVGHHATWERSVMDVFRAAETPWDWTPALAEKCSEMGVEFLSSPYDVGCVDHLNPYVERWKVGSGEITHRDLLKAVAQTGKPVILATGASDLFEVKAACEVLEDWGCTDLTLLQCTTNYSGDPNNVDQVHLRAMEALHWEFDVPVGLSDHTRSLPVALGAVALGAILIERHFTDDRARPGPDHHFAMTPLDWRAMVDNIRVLERALGRADKVVYANEVEARVIQRRCWRATRDLPRGHILEAGDYIALRPSPEGSVRPMVSMEGVPVVRDTKAGEPL